MPKDDLNEDFARELESELRDDPEMAEEFFASDEFPTDNIPALREWVSDQIDNMMPDSRSVTRFLRRHLQTAKVLAILRANWNDD
jgi:hypothetical protein